MGPISFPYGIKSFHLPRSPPPLSPSPTELLIHLEDRNDLSRNPNPSAAAAAREAFVRRITRYQLSGSYRKILVSYEADPRRWEALALVL